MNFLDQRTFIKELKKENAQLRADYKRKQEKVFKAEDVIRNITEKFDEKVLEINKKDEEIAKLKAEKKSLAGNHLLEWRAFLASEESGNNFSIKGEPVSYTDIQVEAASLIDCGFDQGFLDMIKELGNKETFFEPFKKLCYLISMKGRIAGKEKEYSESLLKLITLCQTLYGINKK